MANEIAIIGMAARLPGAPGLPALWDLLRGGREGLTRLPPDTLAAEGVAPETARDPRYVPVAAALADVDRFDAGFWGIGAHEAATMDPQQRIALETAWHALEDAGIDPARAGGAIGVFIGAAISTYLLFRLRDRVTGPSAPSQLLAMAGNDKDYMATQLAYRLDLRGPAISVQTACSSSLVAVHLACQSLLSGECDIAIAGGVSVRVPHHVGYIYEAGGMVSPDGHCRSFADDAAGTVFGSGCGLVVLRRSEDAGSDRVRAVILGSAVNNDGHAKIGFTAPSQDRQSAVIAEAMAVAGIAPRDIGYVEGHGTGTPLGDPVEVAALSAAFRGVPANHCLLGSLKSNIGHTETAAGVAGLIKTVLMLEHGTVVPTLHADRPSTRIDWAGGPFRLADKAQDWTDRLTAGVSSFGIGGTNAHVVVSRAPAGKPPARLATSQLATSQLATPQLAAPQLATSHLVLSARGPEALATLAGLYRDRLSARPEEFPLVCAAAARRPRLDWWIAADSPAELGHIMPRRGEVPHGPVGDGPPVDVPLYPFQRDRHWIDPPDPWSTLLGPAIPTPFDGALHEVNLAPAVRSVLMQHQVDGAAILPAAFHLALMVAGADGAVADTAILQSLALDRGALLQLWRMTDGALRVMSQQDGTWSCLAEAKSGGPADLTGATHLDAEAEASAEPAAAISGAAWMATMAEAGLRFGPAFRLIDRITREGGMATATLDPAAPSNHVTLLDAGLQALGAAVAGVDSGFRPVGVERLVLAPAFRQARTIRARLTVNRADLKTGDVRWFDGDGQVVGEAGGVVCRRAAARVDDMIYRLAWRPAQGSDEAGPYTDLERIARYFARDALVAVPDPARTAVAGLLRRHAAAAGTGSDDPSDSCRTLAAEYPDHAAEIALVARCGAGLPSVLRSEADPVALLFGGDDGAHGAYRLSPLAQRINAAAAAVAHGARPRRVIEIGGGTAATTRALRPALGGTTEYRFTDISPGFLGAAARQFGDWPAFRTGVLDITRSPSGQGVLEGAWDLVVAANVLHATPDLAASLRHARSLLAPGGRLLLIEGTGPQARLDITFGLTDGWHVYQDRALRPDHPLVGTAVWRRLMVDAGLSGFAVAGEAGGQIVMTAVAELTRWMAVGRDPGLADALGLAFQPVDNPLPVGRLDGVIALAGLEQTAQPMADVLALSRILAARDDAPRLLIPTRGAEFIAAGDTVDPARAGLGGFVRTLAREHPALAPRTVDLDMSGWAEALAVETALADGEERVAWRSGQRCLARLQPLPRPEPADTPVRLTAELGIAAFPCPEPGPGEVLIRVRAAGINYKDALTATGIVAPAGAGLGGECAGEIAALGAGVTGLSLGDPVVAVASGALASHVVADSRLALPKPAGLSFVQAAAVPVAGVTAWHALHRLACIRPGQTVLIHSGTGGVGWFAVRFAQAAGATVVATAGTEAKRALLRALGVQEVHSSRDTGFVAAGPVDMVLNALPAAQRDAGLSLVRPGGHFVEIGRAGILTAAEVAARRPDIAYHAVALDQADAPAFAADLAAVLAAVAADPSLLPPATTVPLAEARGAFESMMRAEHIGKLVALPRLPKRIRADGTYVVTGARGGLGPEIVAWLRARGAGGVIGVARRRMAAADTDVHTDDLVIGDVADLATLTAVDVRVRSRGLPPVRGVVHAAGMLEDGLITTLDPGGFGRVARPKLDGAAAILSHWPDLELTIGFSSAGGLLGSAGQATHTTASAAMDAVLLSSAAAGHGVVTVDWGAWRGRGAAAERGVEAALAPGMGSFTVRDGFAALDRILEADAPQAAVLPIDWRVVTAGNEASPLFRDLARAPDKPAEPGAGAATPEAAIPQPAIPHPTISHSTQASPVDRRKWLRERIAAECASMLSQPGTIDPRRPLHELGLDSLAALELRNRLGRLVGAVLNASLLFDYPTVDALTEHLAVAHFGLPPDHGAGPASPESRDLSGATLDDVLSRLSAVTGDDTLAAASDDDLDAALSAFEALHGDSTG